LKDEEGAKKWRRAAYQLPHDEGGEGGGREKNARRGGRRSF